MTRPKHAGAIKKTLFASQIDMIFIGHPADKGMGAIKRPHAEAPLDLLHLKTNGPSEDLSL